MSVVLVAMLLVFTPGRSEGSVAAENASSGTTPYAASGYFYVTQKPGGGWTLVTPQGEPSYSLRHRHGGA
jgi:hypothetical protein